MPDMQNPKFCPFIGRSCVGFRCMFSDLNSQDRNRACLFLRVFSEAGTNAASALLENLLDRHHKLDDSVSEVSGAGH